MRSAGHQAETRAVRAPSTSALRVRMWFEHRGAEVAGEVALGTRREWEAVLDRVIGGETVLAAPGASGASGAASAAGGSGKGGGGADTARPVSEARFVPIESGRLEDVHLDLAELTFVDAHGAASLARAARRLGPDGRMVLHDAPPALCRVLGLLWPGERSIVVRPR